MCRSRDRPASQAYPFHLGPNRPAEKIQVTQHINNAVQHRGYRKNPHTWCESLENRSVIASAAVLQFVAFVANDTSETMLENVRSGLGFV
jgi:hypothetical protein